MKVAFGLVGAGGMGRETMSFLKQLPQFADADICFLETNPIAEQWLGIPYLRIDEFLLDAHRELQFAVAVSASRVRERLAEQMLAGGAIAQDIVHPTAQIGPDVQLGQGAVISAFSFLGAGARIGRMFQCNAQASVHHDCVIGDYVTLAPGARCNGNVHVHDHAYVGASAVIRQGTPERPLVIGEGAVVGMGAVVTKDVAAFTTVVGNPARVLRSSEPG
jgi:sugar O-acyltransferase (sialic acid O-acetyltransferase NeuD family)